jgi:hypothetical protein
MNPQEFLNGINKVTEEQSQTHRDFDYDAVAPNVFSHSKRIFPEKIATFLYDCTGVRKMSDFVRAPVTILK